jgi:hypothetical protein
MSSGARRADISAPPNANLRRCLRAPPRRYLRAANANSRRCLRAPAAPISPRRPTRICADVFGRPPADISAPPTRVCADVFGRPPADISAPPNANLRRCLRAPAAPISPRNPPRIRADVFGRSPRRYLRATHPEFAPMFSGSPPRRYLRATHPEFAPMFSGARAPMCPRRHPRTRADGPAQPPQRIRRIRADICFAACNALRLGGKFATFPELALAPSAPQPGRYCYRKAKGTHDRTCL